MSAGNSPTVRQSIFKRDDWTCRGCGFRQTDFQRKKATMLAHRGGGRLTRYLTIDHIVPVSKGGSDRRENLQTLCNVCNGEKGDSLDAAAPIVAERMTKQARRTGRKLGYRLYRGREGGMLLHDPRCDATFCVNTCPVYLEYGIVT